jgi:hypothetical protein
VCVCVYRLTGFPSPSDMASLVSLVAKSKHGDDGNWLTRKDDNLALLSSKFSRFAGENWIQNLLCVI